MSGSWHGRGGAAAAAAAGELATAADGRALSFRISR